MEDSLFLATAPVTNGGSVGIFHVYLVPAGTIVSGKLCDTDVTGIIEKLFSLQMVSVSVGISGIGLTVTISVKGVPGQFGVVPALGVI